MFASMKEKALSCLSEPWGGKVGELLPLGVGLLLTGLALSAAGNRVAAIEEDLRKRADPVEVVVASVPIMAGEEFTDGNLSKKSVPASGTGKRNVPAGEYELLVGSKAKSRLYPGEPVLRTDVEEPFDADAFSKTVPKGRRALTLSVDTTSSFSGLLPPGDRVDLLAKESGDGTGTWVRNVPVIAVDRHVNRLTRSPDAAETGTVTLMVTPGEGGTIAGASAGGKLFWLLRNPDDDTISPPNARETASGSPAGGNMERRHPGRETAGG